MIYDTDILLNLDAIHTTWFNSHFLFFFVGKQSFF